MASKWGIRFLTCVAFISCIRLYLVVANNKTVTVTSSKCPDGQVWEKKQHAGPLPEFHCLSVGSFMKKQRLELEKEFEGLMKCCLAHDSCYLDCKSEQKYCDTMMKKCLRAYCEGLVGGPKHRKCEGAVDHMLETTEAEGSELYQKFQMLNCQCVSLGREEL